MKSNEQLCLNCNEHFSFFMYGITYCVSCFVQFFGFLCTNPYVFMCFLVFSHCSTSMDVLCVSFVLFYFLFSSFYVLSVSVFNIETWFNLRHWYSWFSIRSCIQRKQIIVYNVLDSYAGNAV